MSNLRRTRSKRIDYKILATTGEKIQKEATSTVVDNNIKQLRECDQSSLSGNESSDQFVDAPGSPTPLGNIHIERCHLEDPFEDLSRQFSEFSIPPSEDSTLVATSKPLVYNALLSITMKYFNLGSRYG